MGAAILSISLQLCKLLTFLSAWKPNVQTFFSQESLLRSGMGQSKTQLGRWGCGLGRRPSLFSEGQPLLEARAGDVQRETRCAGCCLLPRRTPRTHPRPSGLFLQKKKTSRLRRALEDARESRASPTGARKGFGKGTLAMAARRSCPLTGTEGARAGWAGGALSAAPRAALLVSEGFILQLSLCHLPEALSPPSSASPSLPDVCGAGARKFPAAGWGAAASPKAPHTDPKRGEGADCRSISALGDAPVQASGSEGPVISTQLDQELQWGGFGGFLFLFFSK